VSRQAGYLSAEEASKWWFRIKAWKDWLELPEQRVHCGLKAEIKRFGRRVDTSDNPAEERSSRRLSKTSANQA
jgi:hypothetical protein